MHKYHDFLEVMASLDWEVYSPTHIPQPKFGWIILNMRGDCTVKYCHHPVTTLPVQPVVNFAIEPKIGSFTTASSVKNNPEIQLVR